MAGFSTGSFFNNVKEGIGLAVGFSIALGAIKMLAGFIPIPRDFVLANVGETQNTLNWTGRAGEYDLS
jgi:hypothetical protein